MRPPLEKKEKIEIIQGETRRSSVGLVNQINVCISLPYFTLNINHSHSSTRQLLDVITLLSDTGSPQSRQCQEDRFQKQLSSQITVRSARFNRKIGPWLLTAPRWELHLACICVFLSQPKHQIEFGMQY